LLTVKNLKAESKFRMKYVSCAKMALFLAIGSYSPILNDKGGHIGNLGMYTDITERKRAEDAFKEVRDYLENLFNYANAPIIVWDGSFKITRFNKAFERMTGYNSVEVIGKELQMLFPQDSKNESLSKIELTLRGEYWETVEIPILRKDGRVCVALGTQPTFTIRTEKQ